MTPLVYNPLNVLLQGKRIKGLDSANIEDFRNTTMRALPLNFTVISTKKPPEELCTDSDGV